MKMLTANYIANCQLQWANQENIPLEGYTSYTKRVEDNIFNNELHPDTKREYKRGKGHELDGKRAHMKALHSSSALVVNVFDYWRCQNRIQDIANCCGAEGIFSGMEFEKTHPIKGMDRTPPHLDVQFTGAIPLAVESKFTETYHRKTRRDNGGTHLNTYLEHSDIWDGIPKTKALAESISQQSGARTDFEYLDVPQLIKHVLGLTCSYYSRFSLLYLWYKVNSNEAKQHEKELAIFSISIKDEIDFQTMTYQDLFNRITRLPVVDSVYLKYLERRYFSVS
ncbi:MAG: hypothetical protein HW402_322 [Dehalococcoidales bacterium]|nr:hypothetical protein [Dehalococcoidales bacterium]